MTATHRLTAFADNVERYGIEQAIIYAYGLPAAGRVERHQLLISDIRSLVEASTEGGSIQKLEDHLPNPIVDSPSAAITETNKGEAK